MLETYSMVGMVERVEEMECEVMVDTRALWRA